jgi:hypothetical protein
MEKVYNKIDLKFENDYLILLVDNQLIKLKLADISSKLALATDKERNSYKITPSGYGIHWNLLDEDLSRNLIPYSRLKV